MAAEIRTLTRDTVGELVMSAERPVIIDFWGPQCKPCLALAPTYESLAADHPELTFLRVEAPKSRMLCVDLKVISLPTFLCLDGGAEVGRLTGGVSAAELTDWVEKQSR